MVQVAACCVRGGDLLHKQKLGDCNRSVQRVISYIITKRWNVNSNRVVTHTNLTGQMGDLLAPKVVQTECITWLWAQAQHHKQLNTLMNTHQHHTNLSGCQQQQHHTNSNRSLHHPRRQSYHHHHQQQHFRQMAAAAAAQGAQQQQQQEGVDWQTYNKLWSDIWADGLQKGQVCWCVC